jgi:parvulin-like peptidyl-prolyl isomerase
LNRKRVPALLSLAAAASVCLAGCQTDPAAAAVVGGQTISQSSLTNTIDAAMANSQFAGTVGGRAAAARAELSRLITQVIIAKLASRLGVSVTPSQVDSEAAALNSAVQSQQGTTLSTYYAEIGVPPSQDLDLVKAIAQENSIAAKLVAGLPVAQSKLQAAYRAELGQLMQVHVAHILVHSKKLADSILARVRKNPASFAALAARYSTDTGSAKNGGDLGTQTPASFVAPFAAAVETAPVGSFVEVHSQYGWHVIHVISRSVESLAQATPQLKASLLSGQRQSLFHAALIAEARRLHVSVNPRYGVWNVNNLTVYPPADKLSSPSP